MSWYETAFRETYLRVYRHRDEESAAREAELFRRVADLGTGDRVLDLACGAGRHARPLRAAGCRVVALDLSPDLLREAAGRDTGGLVRGDMRALPCRAGAFDAVASFFTSFGYFPDEAGDRRVLDEVARVLRPGGGYLLDLMNRDRAIEALVPRSVDRVDGLDLVQERWFDEASGRIEKSVKIRRPGCSTPVAAYVESVRVYRPEEVDGLLRDADLEPVERLGGFDGSPFDAAVSPRLLIRARRRS